MCLNSVQNLSEVELPTMSRAAASTQVLLGALNVQTQGATAQLTKHKRFQRSFELSELIEQGLTSHQTHYRSYWGRFLKVI